MKRSVILVCIIIGLCLAIGVVSCEMFQGDGGGGGPDDLLGMLREAGYCATSADCDDSDVCTHDICTSEFTCVNPRIANCCYGDEDCADNPDCPLSVCKDNRCNNDRCCDENLSCDHLDESGVTYICETRQKTAEYAICIGIIR